jgi:hypothetical protein
MRRCFLVLVLASAACGGSARGYLDEIEKICRADADCNFGLACTAHPWGIRGHQTCQILVDRDEFMLGSRGCAFHFPGTLNNAQLRWSDTLQAYLEVAYVCSKACSTDRDCNFGTVCSGALCYPDVTTTPL